jgi:hypothetical protein
VSDIPQCQTVGKGLESGDGASSVDALLNELLEGWVVGVFPILKAPTVFITEGLTHSQDALDSKSGVPGSEVNERDPRALQRPQQSVLVVPSHVAGTIEAPTHDHRVVATTAGYGGVQRGVCLLVWGP